jgi:Plavaka transposase
LDPSDPSSRSASEKEEFSRFKNEVYQKVLQKVFSSLRHRSHNGDAHICADGITRVLYPGILIESQDAEEAAYFCGCRAASANHPCPKCLISHSDLHDITGTFADLRTPETMRDVISLASKAKTKGRREEILKDNGLHNVEVSQTQN